MAQAKSSSPLERMLTPVQETISELVTPVVDLSKAVAGQIENFAPLDNRTVDTENGPMPTGGTWIATVEGQPGVYLLLLNASGEVGRSENDKRHFGNTHGAASAPFMLSADGSRFYVNLQASETAAATRSRLQGEGKSDAEIAAITGKGRKGGNGRRSSK